MTRPVSVLLARWWWRRFHPLTRIGWKRATSGSSRTPASMAVAVGLMVVGVLLKRESTRTTLYRGVVEEGSTVRIEVPRGNNRGRTTDRGM